MDNATQTHKFIFQILLIFEKGAESGTEVTQNYTWNYSSRILFSKMHSAIQDTHKWISCTLTFLTWLLHTVVLTLVNYTLNWLVSQHCLCKKRIQSFSSGILASSYFAPLPSKCHVIINWKWWKNPFWRFQNVLRWVWSHWRSKTLSWEHHHISAEDWAHTEADSTSR